MKDLEEHSDPIIALKAGDSGAWVYDSQTFEVYGHIIGKGLFGDVLVMPMHAIVRDIQESLDASDVWLHHTQLEQGVGADSYHYGSLSRIPPVLPTIFSGTSTPASSINYFVDILRSESHLARGRATYPSTSFTFSEDFNTPGSLNSFSSMTNPPASGQAHHRELDRFGLPETSLPPIWMESSYSMNATFPVTPDIQVVDSAYCSPEVTPSNSEISTPERTPVKRKRSSESSPTSKRVRQ